jgi:cysteine desulfurase
MRNVYLDHNATTPLDPEVFEAMKPYLIGEFGNASSIHGWGQRAKAAVEEARENVARLVGARPAEIVFTSGGTESDNTAIRGVVEAALARRGRAHLVTTTIEHHAVLHSAQALERRGVPVAWVAANQDGMIDPSAVERAITAETALISVMHANNELGTVQPVEEIGRIARSLRITFHTDAVQSVGKIPVNVDQLGVSLLSLSAHKLHGPKGAGALYVRKGTPLLPLMLGGHHERDRRAGTENVAGIVGLGKATELALERMEQDERRIAILRDRLEAGIRRAISRASVNGEKSPRLANTSSVSFEGVEGEGLVISLDLKGIACSTGAACSSGSLEPSHVLAAIGKNREQARSTVRFSLGRTTTEEDIEYTLAVLPGVIARLRSLSPYEEAVSSQPSAVSNQ